MALTAADLADNETWLAALAELNRAAYIRAFEAGANAAAGVYAETYARAGWQAAVAHFSRTGELVAGDDAERLRAAIEGVSGAIRSSRTRRVVERDEHGRIVAIVDEQS